MISNSLKKNDIRFNIDTMDDGEQIIGVHKVLTKLTSVKSVCVWSCFFNYIDVENLRNSDLYEDSMTLRDAANNFAREFRK